MTPRWTLQTAMQSTTTRAAAVPKYSSLELERYYFKRRVEYLKSLFRFVLHCTFCITYIKRREAVHQHIVSDIYIYIYDIYMIYIIHTHIYIYICFTLHVLHYLFRICFLLRYACAIESSRSRSKQACMYARELA